MIQIPLEIGDTILAGRFKNKKITVKEIGIDDFGSPTVNGRSILKIRIPKLYQKQENLKEMKIVNKEPMQMVRAIKQNGIKNIDYSDIKKYDFGFGIEVNGFDKLKKILNILRKHDLLFRTNVYNSKNKKISWLLTDKLSKMNESDKNYENLKEMKSELKYIGYGLDSKNKINTYITEITEDRGDEFKGILYKYLYPTSYQNHVGTSKKQWIKIEGNNIYRKKDFIWESGTIKLNMQENNMKLKENTKPFSKQTNVKIKQENNRWHIYLETVDGDECLTPVGFETKELAEHAAMMKGYNFKGNPYSEDYEGLEVEKPTKREKVKGLKEPEEMKLSKEKEIKLESLIKKAIKEIQIKKKVNLKEELTDSELEQKARRFAELAQKMKSLESELKQMEIEYTNLDQELTPLVEQVGKTKDTFIRAGKILIKIEREGYEKKNKSYKTGFEYLYNKVNGTMKDLAEEALKLTETVSYVKSKISVVQGESNLKEESWFTKIKNFLGSKIKKLFGLNNQANQLLTQLEDK